jgi:biotin-dependent carboxylase-like uncharacterized protein
VIEVVKCAGFATVQDLGWRVGRAMGLPRGGAMDPDALRLANALTGNDDGSAGLEIALGGVQLTFSRPVRIALTGGRAAARAGPTELPFDTTLALDAGDALTIGPVERNRFVYLAIDGGIEVPPVLGSRSTYLPTSLGGVAGRRIVPGDQLPLGEPPRFVPPIGTRSVEPDQPVERIRVAPGPQAHLFDAASTSALERHDFTVLPESDRMGTRLRGRPIVPAAEASAPSEATCVGAIQIPDGGQPIVLLVDGPTVGGYPKIGAVVGADLGRFAQLPPGATVRFEWVTIAEAQRLRYQAAERLADRLGAVRGAGRAP